MRVLIMGLPGAGKTTLAMALKSVLETEGYTIAWYNADVVRKKYNDWDFSESGRMRQAHRMREAADSEVCDFAICDFVCPLAPMRLIFAAHFTVWVDTIEKSRFADTNQLFNLPNSYDVRVNTQNTNHWLPIIQDRLLSSYKHRIVHELARPSIP